MLKASFLTEDPDEEVSASALLCPFKPPPSCNSVHFMASYVSIWENSYLSVFAITKAKSQTS